MKEEIKTEIDYKNIQKSIIASKIYKYTKKRYMDILSEESLINDILENCKDDNDKIRKKYSDELEKLELEKKKIFNELQEMDKEDEMEK